MNAAEDLAEEDRSLQESLRDMEEQLIRNRSQEQDEKEEQENKEQENKEQE